MAHSIARTAVEHKQVRRASEPVAETLDGFGEPSYSQVWFCRSLERLVKTCIGETRDAVLKYYRGLTPRHHTIHYSVA